MAHSHSDLIRVILNCHKLHGKKFGRTVMGFIILFWPHINEIRSHKIKCFSDVIIIFVSVIQWRQLVPYFSKHVLTVLSTACLLITKIRKYFKIIICNLDKFLHILFIPSEIKWQKLLIWVVIKNHKAFR